MKYVDEIKGISTQTEIIDNTTAQVLSNHRIPKDHWKQAKEWNYIKQEISRQLSKNIVGRPVPKRPSHTVALRDAIRLTYTYTDFGYPKKLTTDNQKHRYLLEMVDKGNITTEIFLELVSELDVKNKTTPKEKSIEIFF